ncbi:MAG TPA: dienelactone hydrolase family protein [Acidimicrobiales bacterium]|nr:dienelactone hydrolase family protein [Acidimicrobiales bacterium]
MGETVEFPSNGNNASGYVATPSGGSGPGVIVIQEWWGLVPQIKGACDDLAGEGFVALAPDLYHGEIAEHDEMDKAGHLMNSLPMDRAARDMGAAVDYLLGLDATTGGKVGVVGFCMGGMLTLVLAAQQGDKIGAAVPWYGAPVDPNAAPDWSNLTAPVLGHFAENDSFFAPGPVKDLEATLRGMGKDVTFDIYPGTGHAFGNETNALGTFDADAKAKAWSRTVDFLRSKLG